VGLGRVSYSAPVTNLTARILTLVVAFVVGAVYGVAATVGHAYAIGWFPLGLILAVIGSGALLLALRLLTGDRWSALAGGAGLFLTTFVFSQVGPGGSAIVAPQSAATQWVPLAWTLAVPILIALVVTWPNLSHLRGPRGDDPAHEPA
jgi:hypothetical protein